MVKKYGISYIKTMTRITFPGAWFTPLNYKAHGNNVIGFLSANISPRYSSYLSLSGTNRLLRDPLSLPCFAPASPPSASVALSFEKRLLSMIRNWLLITVPEIFSISSAL
ncbi:MAG: hypothetical protein K8R21_13390 [Leptospira sp.]|nr:hypothetical protein [Leptospira sp.]